MLSCIWQDPDWPKFRWDAAALLTGSAEARYKQGRLLGRILALGLEAQLETERTAASEDAVKPSRAKSSTPPACARRLRAVSARDMGGVAPTDQRVEGVVDVVLDATRNVTGPLTAERIFGWHAALFATGYCSINNILSS